jgi:hypothetical protein
MAKKKPTWTTAAALEGVRKHLKAIAQLLEVHYMIFEGATLNDGDSSGLQRLAKSLSQALADAGECNAAMGQTSKNKGRVRDWLARAQAHWDNPAVKSGSGKAAYLNSKIDKFRGLVHDDLIEVLADLNAPMARRSGRPRNPAVQKRRRRIADLHHAGLTPAEIGHKTGFRADTVRKDLSILKLARPRRAIL